MKTLINYIRQCFCKHEWHIEEEYVEESLYPYTKESMKQGIKVYMRCKKCGYNKNHWKYF